MISKILSVILLVSAANCGHIGFRTALPFNQVPFVEVPIQAIPRVIPTRIGSLLPATNFGVIQHSVPQYLYSLPQSVNFQIPQRSQIPPHLLSITHPGAAPLSAPGYPPVKTFVSPAQQIRLQPIAAISSVPAVETPILRQTQELPQTPEIASLPRFDSNAYSGSQSEDNQRGTGFSTPVKPLNFAPNLPEVNKPLPQNNEQISPLSVETPKNQQMPEPIQQKIEEPLQQKPIDFSAQPLSEQRVESAQPSAQQNLDSAAQPLSQQRIDSSAQPLSQQTIDSAPQPLAQQRIESIPQSNNQESGITSQLNQIPNERPSMSLNSYSF